ncbi:MAG: tetratricopeptide repeat protein, partial [Deltaproteobacteria bacterium]|nr:tetratricopeptide repeat protein [Deltaproteobacteria bacterium]
MTMRKILVLAILALFWAGCATTAGNGVKGESIQPDEAKARAHLSLGAAHLRNGRLIRALKELLDAEKYDRQNADIQNHLGLAYKELNKYPLAVRHLKKALALRKNFPEAHNSLGTVYLARKMYAEALTEFNIVLSDILYTTPQYAHFNIGQVYLDQG